MNEAKWYLKNWRKWKRIVQLLEETRDQLKNTTQGININTSEMPGGSHKPITDKFNKIIEECDKYDDIINKYNFFIDMFEKSITTLLTKEQREVFLIYANHPKNFKRREFEALKQGHSRSNYYRVLDESMDILNEFLELKVGTNLGVNK